MCVWTKPGSTILPRASIVRPSFGGAPPRRAIVPSGEMTTGASASTSRRAFMVTTVPPWTVSTGSARVILRRLLVGVRARSDRSTSGLHKIVREGAYKFWDCLAGQLIACAIVIFLFSLGIGYIQD